MDDEISIQKYELQAELAMLKEERGDLHEAADLWEVAADGAVENDRPRLATDWSLKAEELRERMVMKE